MPKSVIKRKNKRVQMPSFGCVCALLFIDGGGSAEISMGSLEMSRLLRAWEEVESVKKSPDERVLAALRLLIPKARTLAPEILAEVPIARTKRVRLMPDFGDKGQVAQV
ncbi:MAG: hypothetical protein ABR991_03085 [Terracidiphilus sp.]|jgi:hypothetical protein